MNKFLLALLIFSSLFKDTSAQSLTSLGGGVTQNGNIVAIEYDATYNYLYIAGEIRAVNGVHVGYIARWDGTTWTSLNGGMDGTVTSLKLIGHKLFAGGYFQNAGGVPVNNIAYWDDTTWVPAGTGLNCKVRAIEFFNNTLYAAGTTPGGSVTKLYEFNGTSWTFNGMQFDRLVHGMTASDSALFIYGEFRKANADTAYGLASFNGTSLFVYPNTSNYGIYSLVLKDSSIYVSGTAWMICRWVNGIWQGISTPSPEEIKYVYNYNDTLYAVSDSGSRGAVLHIRKVVNGVFQPPSARIVTNYYINESINAVRSSGTKLFIGSSLVHFGDTLAMCLFHYDGSNWTNPGKPAGTSYLGTFNYSAVNCILKDSITGDIIVGGRFFFAGEKYCANVARWDGTQWNPMGDGLSNEVRKLLYFNNELYAVGYFGRSGANWVGRIAKWNGSSWQAISVGANSGINDAVVYRNELYVGGAFTTIDGINANYCAKYDGTTWSTVPNDSLDDYVTQLCVYNDTLVAGLDDWAGGSSNKKIFCYSGSSWMLMGLPSSRRSINSLLVFNNRIYMAAESGIGILVDQWNGTSWQRIGTIPSTYIKNGRLFNFHNQLAVSCTQGFYLYDGTNLNKVSSTTALVVLNESPVKDYFGGTFSYILHGTTFIEINCIGTLDFTLPQINLSLSEDTICERLYGNYHASSQDIFTTLHWHFTGGLPDTLSNAWDPVIQYIYPGNYSSYLVVTNLVGTDTIFFSSNITVLPCIASTDDISTSIFSPPFPNPFTSTIKINSSEFYKTVFISDITGKIILKWPEPKEKEFDLSELQAGIYILSCTTENQTHSYKILKQ